MGAPQVVGRVRRLGLTPLKGAAHLHPARVDLAAHGPVGDRGWCLVEHDAAGALAVARTVRTPGVLRVRAHVPPGGGLALDLPGGHHHVPEPSVPATPSLADYWGRPAPVTPVPGPWDAALGDLVGRPVALARVLRPGAVVYADPLVLVTTSSLRELSRRTGAPLDDERFRSLVLVGTDDAAPFVEDTWSGRVLRLGGARVLVGDGVARCAVVQRVPGTGARATDDLLGALAADRAVDGPGGTSLLLGVGARVLDPGPVALGDEVALEG
ncbi:MOSC domain-containing protein [Pseudokineococcus lusitanus]|uniref:Uncharacterized protein YcbX n=1 Tax=Pseudokineococcus lusitanus TaxID=763993 RepID=A0A3N1HLR9_9ACTN|nr:MOSC N-terminal beta barrel domain-containing protein [Pseudokineococcus lusitanus]ROP43395.1 uncharacterized protein YcbX [Pseudokineococcus lusitanus]